MERNPTRRMSVGSRYRSTQPTAIALIPEVGVIVNKCEMFAIQCAVSTNRQVSVSNADWTRLGQFSARKVQLPSRSNGLIVNLHTGTAFLSQ